MENRHFDRNSLVFRPLDERKDEIRYNSVRIAPSTTISPLPEEETAIVRQTALDILAARQQGRSRMLTFGTDLIRNGLAPVVGEFIRRGWLTHLATTGTSAVDDWEFAARGAAAEDGRDGLTEGFFGMWDETSRLISLAVMAGAMEGLGLGESIARVISTGRIVIPDRTTLAAYISDVSNPEKVSAAAALLDKIKSYDIPAGEIRIEFPFRRDSLMRMAYEAGIPFTIHPMFGLDVPFMHPMCSFAAVGQGAEADFLYFVENVKNLDGGVYLSVGSSVASPMIFEKALSMSQNVLQQKGGSPMTRHKIVVVDLSTSKWDWMKNGEPPETRPEYYLRYCKSFSRAKAESMYYVCADNRDFMLNLFRELDKLDNLSTNNNTLCENF